MLPNKPARGPGRPANPYIAAVNWFAPKATVDWLQPVADLEASCPHPGKFRDTSAAKDAAYGLLISTGLPMPRRVIESILVHDHGFYPVAVTAALQSLGTGSPQYNASGRIVMRELNVPGQAKPSHVYTWNREPTNGEIKALLGLIKRRNSFLTKERLRDAGEEYVRGWLLKEGGFVNITIADELGEVGPKPYTLDLAATDRVTAVPYGISVKNERAWLKANSKNIDDVIRRAARNQMKPWLFMPFALDTAIQQCRESGVRLTTLGKQIVPVSVPGRMMALEIESLRAVLGVEEYGFVHARAERSEFTGIRTFEPD